MSIETPFKRGRDSLYTNPMFSLSDLYEPKNIKEIFNWCRKLALTNEIVSASIHKLSESPITDLTYEHSEVEVQDRFRELMEDKMHMREALLGLVFDLVTYSNTLASVEVPVTRFLVSPAVHKDVRHRLDLVKGGDMTDVQFDNWYAEASGEPRALSMPKRFKINAVDWQWGNGYFRGTCPKTGKAVKFERVDRYYASSDNLKLKRWDINQVEIHYNEITGDSKYYYRIRHATRELIRRGDPDMLSEVPWEYVVAARNNRNVRLLNDHIFHLTNAKISGAYQGWGIPRLYSAFRMVFYYLTLLRANQSIAVGKINDLQIIFPQMQGSATGIDPAGALPSLNFTNRVSAMINQHHKDPNFTGISPIPVGSTSIFGQGRMQLVSGELEPVTRAITTALGLPYDMLYGGGAFTGQAVAQRLFSAQTALSRERFNELLDFVVRRSNALLGESKFPKDMSVKLREHEGPDALATKQTITNMALSGKVSISTALEQWGLEWDKERDRLESEAKDMARITKLMQAGEARANAEAQGIMARSMKEEQDPFSAEGETLKSEEGAETGAGEESVDQQAKTIFNFITDDPGKVDQVLQMADKDYPDAAAMVREWIRQGLSPGDMPSMEAPSAEAPPADGFRVEKPPPDTLPGTKI